MLLDYLGALKIHLSSSLTVWFSKAFWYLKSVYIGEKNPSIGNFKCDAWLWRYYVIKLSSVLLNLLKLTCNSSYLMTLTFVDNLSTTGTRGSSPANILHPGLPRLPFLSFSPLCSRTSTCSTFPLRTWRAWNRFYGSWFSLFSCQKFNWNVGFLVGDICLLCNKLNGTF